MRDAARQAKPARKRNLQVIDALSDTGFNHHTNPDNLPAAD